jgi:hypothetical protein
VTEAAQSMPPQIIATIDARTGYDGLIVAVRARVAETGLNSRMIDELSGLTPGYTGKLLGAAQIEQFGLTGLLAIAATLGLAFDVKIDPEQEALMRPHWEPGQHMQRRTLRKARLGRIAIKRILLEAAREMQKRGADVRNHDSPRHSAAQLLARPAWRRGGRACVGA